MNEQDAPGLNERPDGWRGYFRASRHDDALELLKLKPPFAFVLAYVIAARAKWEDKFDRHDLKFGEAFIGDFENYGMTESNYRSAKAQLSKWKFATFKTTSKGTIAQLMDKRLFEVVPTVGRGQFADRLRATHEQDDRLLTTNLKLKSIEQKSEKAYSTTKASKLSRPQWEIANRFEAVLDGEWVNDAGKWINRIKSKPGKCERVVAEVESAAKEDRIKTSAARYAEETWKRFK